MVYILNLGVYGVCSRAELLSLANIRRKKEGSIPSPISIDKTKVIPFSTMPPRKQNTTNHRYVTERYINEHHYQLTRSQFERKRSNLPKSLYWIQPSSKGGRILWNLPLFLSLMANGADSPEHQALVEEYISTLPTAA